MKTIKVNLLLIIIAFVSVNSMAQDIHFSQFYMSPLNLNPAMTGVMNCKNRFIGNYRNQWAAVLGSNAFNTYSASYDQKTPVGRDDYFGLGGTLWGDVAGASRFGTTQGRLSGSYSKKMAGYRKKASYLVMGVDLGITQRRVRTGDLLWPGQIESNGVINADGGEVIANTDFIYADLSAGLLWFSVIDKYTNWYIGIARHHLNTPRVSFYEKGASESVGDATELYARNTVHAGLQFPMKPKITLLPFGVFMMQGPHREFNAGANVRFALGPSRNSNQSFELGAWYRLGVQAKTTTKNNETVYSSGLHSDAVILSTRFNYEDFGIGFSYDVNVSKLAAAGAGNGAFEFSMIYNICGPENRGVYCPRF